MTRRVAGRAPRPLPGRYRGLQRLMLWPPPKPVLLARVAHRDRTLHVVAGMNGKIWLENAQHRAVCETAGVDVAPGMIYRDRVLHVYGSTVL